MYQKEVRRNSRSLPTRFNISWFATQKNGWNEEKCIEMDKLAQENFTYRPSSEENERKTKKWYISLNTSGRNASMKLRSDFSEALTKMHRFNRESGEERPAPIPFYRDEKWHSSSFFIQYLVVAVEWPLVDLFNKWKSTTSELVECAASKNTATCWRRAPSSSH